MLFRSLFGAGISAFLGQAFQGENLSARTADGIPGLRDIPVIGPALFTQHWLVYFALIAAAAVAGFLYRTRAGLVLRAVGESPDAAHALGIPVRRVRLAALVFGGGCAGMAGAFLSVIYTPLWSEGMSPLRSCVRNGWISPLMRAATHRLPTSVWMP